MSELAPNMLQLAAPAATLVLHPYQTTDLAQ